MRLPIEVTGDTERRIAALAYITGQPMHEIARLELAASSAPLSKPLEVLTAAIERYCDGPLDRFDTVQRFKHYRDNCRLAIENYEIEATVAEAIGELEPGQAWLLVEAGKLLTRRPTWKAVV